MGFLWKSHFSASAQQKLMMSLSIKLLSVDLKTLGPILKGLKDVKYYWQNEGIVEKAIFKGIVANYQQGKRLDSCNDAYGIASCVHSLGELSRKQLLNGEPGVTLNKAVLDSFWNGIEQCSKDFMPRSLSNLIWG
jgi:hypothetical protein